MGGYYRLPTRKASVGRARERAATKGAVKHLEEALSAAENDEVQFHIKQALQLLGIRE
jgi:hypothetical protein